jgi:hypothetical protein
MSVEDFDVDFERDYALRMIDEGNYNAALQSASTARLAGYRAVAKEIEDGVRDAQVQYEGEDDGDEN